MPTPPTPSRPRVEEALVEYRRLLAVGVSDPVAVYLAGAVVYRPGSLGTTWRAYGRHKRHASPQARAAWAAYQRGRR